MVGHWRFTDVLSSGGFSLVTDIHIVLEADGTGRTWMNDASGDDPRVDEGIWKLEDGRLYMSPPDGDNWQEAGRITVDGDRMRLIQPNGTIQVFERL